MTTLGKIIYAADKIEPTRGYDSSAMIDMMEKMSMKALLKF